MSPLIIYSKYVEKLGVNAITLYPFIFVNSHFKNQELFDKNIIIRHERIHIAQYEETLVVGFYIIYTVNYVMNLFRFGFNHKKAYRNVAFEREAYTNDSYEPYTRLRDFWGWVHYL